MKSVAEFLVRLRAVYAFFGRTSLNTCAIISIAQPSEFSRRGSCVPLQHYQHTCCSQSPAVQPLCRPGPALCSPMASVLIFTSIYLALYFADVNKIFDVGNESSLLSGYSWTFQVVLWRFFPSVFCRRSCGWLASFYHMPQSLFLGTGSVK